MGKSMTFLQLSQEFGGTRFGPFDAVEIRLGSDPDQSDITLPADLGVAPQHVKVLKQQDESFILAPVDRTAAVFFYRSTGGRPKQVTAPLACKPGDSFAMVTAEGPRFFIQSEKNPKAIKEAAADAQGPGLGINTPNIRPEGIVAEIKRRGLAAVFTTKLGNMWMTTWRMVKTGQIFSPVYIVGGMIMVFGWLGLAGSGCAVMSLNTQKIGYQKELTVCRDQLGVGEQGEVGDPTGADLTKNVLIDGSWKTTIESDNALRDAYVKELKIVYQDPNRYSWVYKNKGSPYNQFKGQLEKVGLPENLVRVLAFAAAGGRQDQDWFRVQDSEGEQVCGRGPVGLTYRQARALGMTQLQPDALVEAQLAESGDVAKQRERLDATLRKANDEHDYRDDLIQNAGAALQGGQQCLFVDGTDDRDSLSEVAQAVQRKVGAGARLLPSEGQSYWVASRLMMYGAQDFRFDLDNVQFDAKTPPSVALEVAQVPEGNVRFAVREAARIMARAAAIPCMARFDKDQREPPPWLLKTPPPLGQCAILRAYVDFDRM